ncbi:cryptochrome/photolyase family protein [Halorubrum gandharaense]
MSDESDESSETDETTLWLLGDRLDPPADALARADEVLLVESHEFAARRRYHAHKLTLVFSAMRHCRDRLRDRGHDVTYLRADSFGEALDEYLGDHPADTPTLETTRPTAERAADRLHGLVRECGGTLEFRPDDRFFTDRADWGEFAGDDRDPDRTYRQEDWYRHVRREHDILMTGGERGDDSEDSDPEPLGGEWNYDDLNRETPPDDWEPPAPKRFEPDELTRETHRWVVETFETWGESSLDGFGWPVTPAEAREALDDFIKRRLPSFGRYQDAMVGGEPFVSHSLLSPALNLGLLDPRQVVDAVETGYAERGVEPGAYDPVRDGTPAAGTTATLDEFGGGSDERDDGHLPIPLNAAEGFLRQVVGWREFVRHVYRERMPEMAAANQLDQTRDLPPAFWDGETEMQCLSEAVSHVREFGYAHHIERLMVLSNVALLYGTEPAELTEWFHLGFVDAFHWVTTPNVVGMGSFGTDALSTKPYASSGNYVNRMSDHCADCSYAVSRTTGEGACPLNALYWDFLAEKESELRETGRMGLMYSHLDDKREAGDLSAIRERAAALREGLRDGEV